MSDILSNLVSLVLVLGAGGGATYWIVRYVNATIKQSEERIVQYQQMREEMSKNFEQLRRDNAKNVQDNAKNAQEIARAVQENAQNFARLEEMIRNLQSPQGGVGGSSESSDEKPGGRR